MQPLDDKLIEYIASADPGEQDRWLILEPSGTFRGCWDVSSLGSSYLFDLEDDIGRYRCVRPSELEHFLGHAEGAGYLVAVDGSPGGTPLQEPLRFPLESGLAGTSGGLLPFQLEGFNKLYGLNGGLVLWSTGGGKAVFMSAVVNHYWHEDAFDLAVLVPKGHNKINTQRKLKAFTGLEATILDGDKKKRRKQYAALSEGKHVVVTNYEKFKFDFEEWQPLFEKRLLIVWDEMPVKLSNRRSQLYESVRKLLYGPKAGVGLDRLQPSWLKQYATTATPVENTPEGWFNCVRLIDPSIFGTVAQWESEYVARYSYFNKWKPEEFQNLDKMFLKLDHMTHIADKRNDPKIAIQFPRMVPDTEVIEWEDRRIYDALQKGLLNKIDEEGEIEVPNVLGMITILQMLCDAPSMIPRSAKAREQSEERFLSWIEEGALGKEPIIKGSLMAMELCDQIGWDLFTDDNHPKLNMLRRWLTEDFRTEKVLVYSAWAGLLLPTLSGYLTDWGVSHVVYHGTAKQMQEAHDSFKRDDSIQVLLSSDRGSDSVDFEEARHLVHYNLPWKWATKEQRENRNNRIISEFDVTYAHMMLMADSVEERKAHVLAKKFSYHQSMLTGKVTSVKTRKLDDLLYMLGVERDIE